MARALRIEYPGAFYHYHMLVETPEANLSRAIKWVNVSYAGYFNRKRQRRGHLFQGRHRTILVDADEYLKQLSRYIHLNPIRAKMVTQSLARIFSAVIRPLSAKSRRPNGLK